MNLILPLIMGVFSAYAGLLPPGMLNMTTAKNTLTYGRRNGLLFAGGASVVVIAQASIALIFSSYFKDNPQLIDLFKTAGGFVFLILSIYFFYLARKQQKFNPKSTTKRFFISGMAMSVINMLAIPFYIGLSTYWSVEGILIMEFPYTTLFIIGCGIGSFLLFCTYIYFASVIERKASFIAQNINYILAILFLVLCVLTYMSR